jgi:threonine synthase
MGHSPPPTLTCVRCGAPGRPSDPERYLGCPRCRSDGEPANYRWEADLPSVADAVRHPSDRAGIWRFAGALPVDTPVTLGEGNTPLVRLDELGAAYGVANLYAKNESANPTWSHKDRLAAVTVAVARHAGARVVAAASTGNHGAAVAAYAARAGLRCVIATLAWVPTTMKRLMAAYGAEVVATTSSDERYQFVRAGVERHGWYPASNITSPAVGSDSYGIAGYKTIAYELVEQLGGAPDWLVMPVAYGDCLAGVAQGFAELHATRVTDAMPRIVGAELYGALEGALGGAGLGPVPTGPTAAFSIAGSYTTHQAVAALQLCDGFARSVSDDDIARARRELGLTSGLLVEAAAAAPLAAVRGLASDGAFAADDVVVCLLTSTGLKDRSDGGPSATCATAPELAAFRASLMSGGRLDAATDADLFGEPTSVA